MRNSETELREMMAQTIHVNDDALVVDLVDGRTVTIPLAWFPRLAHGTPHERANWRLIGGGEGIHWPDLDEDISVESLLAGRRSGESQASLLRWLDGRVRLVPPQSGAVLSDVAPVVESTTGLTLRLADLMDRILDRSQGSITAQIQLSAEGRAFVLAAGQLEGEQPAVTVPSPSGAYTAASVPQPPVGAESGAGARATTKSPSEQNGDAGLPTTNVGHRREGRKKRCRRATVGLIKKAAA